MKARGRSPRRTDSPRDGLSPAPHVERAYSNLKAGIVEGRYRPGAPLSEVTLALEHGMSRTPIREGLARLWQEGYLERVVGHGYFVARVTVQQIHDTFDVRRLLEGAAAARAAELATAEEIDRLRRLAAVPIRASQSYRESEVANVQFHLAIAGAARNGLALELIERCLAQVDRFMSLGVSFGPFQDNASEAHRQIVEAIAAHDPAGARGRMEEHLDVGSRLMKDALMRGHVSGISMT
ncbi:MAG TPA: GntR family transcriptional regulator [Vicinamibacterales bacterium]|jgi:DNA-binding GntR family transcriptional regulator|nr:GntR family transcriptional regulator [Vicinamibacterales bacterium]